MTEQPKKILIVEDEGEMSNMIRMRLESVGYKVISASNGQEGLSLVKKECPDLIISDVLMPVMDGFAFYKELKKDKNLSDIPVLILTARGKMEDSFKVMGVDDFIAKPFEGKDLLEKVESLLSRVKFRGTTAVAKRVLVAGGFSEVLDDMVFQLKKGGCHVDLVTAGEQVISKAVLFLPNVLIADVQMSGMDTQDIIKVLRQMPQFQGIPIITYSYYPVSDLGSQDIRQRALSIDAAQSNCMASGATAYIGRFNETIFFKAISKYL